MHTEAIASGNNAAVARAYAPPTDDPQTAARDMPSCARIACTAAVPRPAITVSTALRYRRILNFHSGSASLRASPISVG
jgi:hypothetical protein